MGLDGNVRGYSVRSPKKCNSTKHANWCTGNLNGIVWNSGRLDYSDIPNILPGDLRGECFAKKTEK